MNPKILKNKFAGYLKFIRKSTYLVLLIGGVLVGCQTKNPVEEKIAQIPVKVQIERFDEQFAHATATELPSLKKDYPYLFPAQYPDSLWLARIEDSLHQVMTREIAKQFSGFSQDTVAIGGLFQHLKYYFPDFKEPKVITVNSDVDYPNRIIYADSLLLVGLDNYLGEEHEFYKGIQQYIRAHFDKKYLVADMARAIARSKVPVAKSRDFLSKMVYYGKLYYLMETLLPGEPVYQLLGYTQAQWDWAVANEQYMWRYFVERELLYSTDSKLDARFLDPAPFSKFYLELDNESPGRLGRFIGWRMVDAYMKNNAVSLQQLLEQTATELFTNSQYKPEK